MPTQEVTFADVQVSDEGVPEVTSSGVAVSVIEALLVTVTVCDDWAVPLFPEQVRVKVVVCDGVTFSPVLLEVVLDVLDQFV